ncbi:MAG: flagellar hook protein FliD, partial [Gammaproteobacteria bacterium]|nr:flagellar hook protein FliD [Gammaproteobacteria bacterium]
MASISSPGIGSGLDINSIVSQLMTVERRPVAQLNQKEADYQARLTAYGTFKGTLSSFQSAMRGLSNINNYQGRTASSGNSEVFTATASTGAVAGNYSVEVVQRASAQKLASQGFNNTSDAVG